MCDWASQHYKLLLPVVNLCGVDANVCFTPFDVNDPGLNLPFGELFVCLFKFHLTHSIKK